MTVEAFFFFLKRVRSSEELFVFFSGFLLFWQRRDGRPLQVYMSHTIQESRHNGSWQVEDTRRSSAATVIARLPASIPFQSSLYTRANALVVPKRRRQPP